MSNWLTETIANQSQSAQRALLELNNAHAQETSFLTTEKWQHLVDEAYSAKCFKDSAGLLLAMDQDARYDSHNFNWFCERYKRFVYVDRIIVADGYRGQGLARLFYEDLFQHARQDSHDKVVCEVNLEPPNPVSEAFHVALGFTELGRGPVGKTDRVVCYLGKLLV